MVWDSKGVAHSLTNDQNIWKDAGETIEGPTVGMDNSIDDYADVIAITGAFIWVYTYTQATLRRALPQSAKRRTTSHMSR